MKNPFSLLFKPSFILFILLSFAFNLGHTQISQEYKSLQVDGTLFSHATNVIFEDSFGFLWFGTNNGLFKYDGNSLIEYQYDVFDNKSLPNNTINSIVEDKNKNLWVGCASYLAFYNRKTDSFEAFYKRNRAIVINNDVSNDQNIFVNLQSERFARIKPSTNHEVDDFERNFKDSIRKDKLTKENHREYYMTDLFGRVIFGTENGIKFLDKKLQIRKSNFLINTLILKPFINNSFIAVTKSHLYIIGYNKSNYKLQILEEYETPLHDKFPGTTPLELCINEEKSEFWLASEKKIVYGKRNQNKFNFETIKINNLPLNHKILSLEIDNFKNLWIGTNKGVIKHIKHSTLFKRLPLKARNESSLSALFLDKNGNIYTGLSTGIICNLNSGKEYCETSITSGKKINSITYNYDKTEVLIAAGNKLLTTKGLENDLTKSNIETLNTYNRTIKYLLPLNKNELWIGFWNSGLGIINETTPLSSFKKDLIKKMENAHISVMHLTKKNILWIGSRGKGLYKIDLTEEKYEHILPTKNGLSSNAILCLLENPETNELFIGTRGGGLNIYNYKLKEFTSYNKSDGLPSTTVSAMKFDTKKNIWLSTQSGLSRFNLANKSFTNFDSDNGILESEFEYNLSLSLDSSTKLLFAYQNGIYSVKPNDYIQNQHKANTFITKFSVLGAQKEKSNHTHLEISNEHGSHNQIKIPHDQNNISIEFASLDLTSPNKNEFAYMLEGINDYWIHTSSNRSANYNDLAHGNYTFKVKSSNSDGIWNEIPAVLKFEISPPFWKTTLAYILYSILIALIVYISIVLVKRWYRLKKNLVEEKIIRKKEQELSKAKMVFFTDISHEIRTPLTIIQGTVEKIINKKNNVINAQSAIRIQNNSFRISKLINQIMDIRKLDEYGFKIKVEQNNIIDDVLKIKNAFNDFAKSNLINYTLNHSRDKIDAWYDIDILEKILLNLLSNAFKYTAENGKISITLEELESSKNKEIKGLPSGKYIQCNVKDNGIGIPEKDLKFVFDRYYQSDALAANKSSGTGIGMELVHKLIQKHHGKITVQSEEGLFTEFIFWLPIDKQLFKDYEISMNPDSNRNSLISKPEFQIDYQLRNTDYLENTEANKTNKPTILLVEDNIEQRKMLLEEMQSDYYVIEAPNGQIGYEKALQEKPQLIISDIYMPELDGISLLKKLKNNKETNDIPIFMLTARDSKEIKLQCVAFGAHDYIEKPYSIEFIKWKIHNILSTRNILKEKYSKLLTVESTKVNIESNEEKFIKKLIKIIENSLEKNELGVEYLAQEIGMSRANLYRKLQSILNETPVNFIKQIRLRRACELLKNSNMYISEVAYMTGFSNQQYFTKCFTKNFGISPSQYAKQYATSKDDETTSKIKALMENQS